MIFILSICWKGKGDFNQLQLIKYRFDVLNNHKKTALLIINKAV